MPWKEREMTLPGMADATPEDRLGVELARAQNHLVRALRDAPRGAEPFGR